MAVPRAVLLGRINDQRILGLGRVGSLTVTKDSISATGRIQISSGVDLAAVLATRDQLAAMVDNPDEPIVPFQLLDDPTLTQMVRVRSASVQVDSGGLDLGYFPWSITLDRIPAGSLPRVKSAMLGTVRTNVQAQAITDTIPWHGWSAKAVGYAFDGSTASYSARTGPGGSARVIYFNQDMLNGYASWTINPADYYDMAAQIQAGTTLRPLVGRWMDSAENLTTWELSNGLVKITPGSGTALLNLTVPVGATPSTWATSIPIDVGYVVGASWFAFGPSYITNVMVLRNSPEVCALRLVVSQALSSQSSYFTVDLLLRRGDRICYVTVRSPQSRKYGIGTNAVTTMTDLLVGGFGYGIRRSATDGDGNRICMFTAESQNRDTVNGRITLASTQQSGVFALTSEINVAAVPTQDAYTTLRQMFFAAQNETQEVVAP